MILQKTLPYNPFDVAQLPAISALEPSQWLRPDTCAGAQIAVRQQLIAEREADVIQMDSCAYEAAQELLETVHDHLVQHHGGPVDPAIKSVTDLDFSKPLQCLGTLTQQDFCILQKPEGQAEHLLTAAVLCFPASWRLADKFMRPLTHIHRPVPEYDAGIAKRVQRLFDGVQVGRPLWRFNALWYQKPDLYHPVRDPVPADSTGEPGKAFFRSEEQTVLRLPRSKAVVFSIHTRVLAREDILSQYPPVPSIEEG